MRKITSIHIYTVNGTNNVSIHRSTRVNSRKSNGYYDLTPATIGRLAAVADKYGVCSYHVAPNGYSAAVILLV